MNNYIEQWWTEGTERQIHTRMMDIVTSYETTDLLSLIAQSSNTENSSLLQVIVQVRKGKVVSGHSLWGGSSYWSIT